MLMYCTIFVVANKYLLTYLLTYYRALSSSLVPQMSNKEDFEDFEAMTENTDFFT